MSILHLLIYEFNKGLFLPVVLSLPFFLFYSCSTPSSIRKPEAEKYIQTIGDFWINKNNQFRDTSDVWGNYTLNLNFEALLEYDRLMGRDKYTSKILEVMSMRNISAGDTISYLDQPFCSLEYSLFLATEDSSWLLPYAHETEKMKNEMRRTAEGAVCFYGNPEYEYTLLIDFIQEYCLRMARTGYITGDDSFFEECVEQFKIHEDILKDPSTGLWSQGRGWLSDRDKISPGAWSRGHGWLLRGMVQSLTYLPDRSKYYNELRTMVNELISTLLEYRDNEGMWHVLLNRDFKETYPETSGTGMITGYSAVALHRGFLTESNIQKVRKVVVSSSSELRKYVLFNGDVLNSCEGPGPLRSEYNYLEKDPEPGNEHGYQAFIHAFIGVLRLPNTIF